MNKLKTSLLALALLLNISAAKEVYAIFNVEAVEDANLTLDASGTISQILVDVGSNVKAGDVLLKLQNEDKIDNVMIQRANSASINSQLNFAKKQYDRYKKIGKAVDRNTLDQYYSNYMQLKSSFTQSEYNIKLQRALLAKTILTAPFDGVIAEKNVDLGDGVTANSTKLFRIVSFKRKIVLLYDSKYINDVKIGDIFKYTIDGSNKPTSVKITKIYPTVDVNTRKVTAEAQIETNLTPGLFGDGYITTAISEENK